jgi:hypothetical protein
MLKKLLIACGVAVVLGIGVVAFLIGPRNIIGMLRYDIRSEGALQVGDRAPDVRLLTLDGKEAHLQQRFGARPAVIIFGSFT